MESDFFGSYTMWRKARMPFCWLIKTGDYVLDVGCANGFLLKCIALWEETLQFIPFGIDINAKRLFCAQRIHGEHKSNFKVHNMFHGIPFKEKFYVIITPWLGNETPKNIYTQNIKNHKSVILFYLYDDDVSRFEYMESEVAASGWKVNDSIEVEQLTKIVCASW